MKKVIVILVVNGRPFTKKKKKMFLVSEKGVHLRHYKAVKQWKI
jgi:hypothetical protein